jgi:hypothetical protein
MSTSCFAFLSGLAAQQGRLDDMDIPVHLIGRHPITYRSLDCSIIGGGRAGRQQMPQFHD